MTPQENQKAITDFIAFMEDEGAHAIFKVTERNTEYVVEFTEQLGNVHGLSMDWRNLGKLKTLKKMYNMAVELFNSEYSWSSTIQMKKV